MAEKRCRICGKEVTENYCLDSRGYTCYLCSKAIMNETSKVRKLMEEYEYD